VYLRRDSAASAALRDLETSRRAIGVFTDAPEPLARVALAHLGVDRRISALETGEGALDRLLARLGDDAVVVRTHEELLAACT
jgi:phosphoglycolate phosphatase-like HAD superfamily hydrolase